MTYRPTADQSAELSRRCPRWQAAGCVSSGRVKMARGQIVAGCFQYAECETMKWLDQNIQEKARNHGL